MSETEDPWNAKNIGRIVKKPPKKRNDSKTGILKARSFRQDTIEDQQDRNNFSGAIEKSLTLKDMPREKLRTQQTLGYDLPVVQDSVSFIPVKTLLPSLTWTVPDPKRAISPDDIKPEKIPSPQTITNE